MDHNQSGSLNSFERKNEANTEGEMVQESDSGIRSNWASEDENDKFKKVRWSSFHVRK